MYKSIYRIVSAILLITTVLGNYINAQAKTRQAPLSITGSTYYVSTTGNDSNAGTLLAPFKTFKKATSMLGPGSILYILPGVYNEALRISNSGVDGASITIQSYGSMATIDLKNASNPAVYLQGSYITLNNLEVKGSNDICVLSSGSYIHISGLVVHDCQTHGIHVTGQHVEVTGNTVYATSLANQTRTASSGWGSGIKVGLNGNDILIANNSAFNNYGEGIASTQGSNVTIRENTTYDNFSVNIYVDNSFDIVVEKNLVTCHPNSGFERDGSPATGIGLGEEAYSGWGAQLNQVTIRNNLVAYCKFGVYYYGADAGLANGGFKNSSIVYNTLWASTDPVIGITYDTGQTNSLIANNIIWQANNKLAYIENYAGLTFQNNLWKVTPPSGAKGAGDRIGDPTFAATPGYTAESFKLGSLSPAIGGAANIGILTDYFGNPRGPSYEMGALQFLNALPSPTQTISTNTPISSPTAMLTQTASPLPSLTPTALSPSVTATALLPTATSTTVPFTPTKTAQLPSPTSMMPTVTPQTLEMLYNDNDVSLKYSIPWQVVNRGKAFGGSYSSTNKPGSFVTLSFTGQSISLLYTAGKSFGKLDVYIDNQLITILDQKASKDQFQVKWDYQGKLPTGQHELKLIFSGPEQLNGSIDAVIVR